MKREQFLKIISSNYNAVKKWPKWKQSIIISARAASTGIFMPNNISRKGNYDK